MASRASAGDTACKFNSIHRTDFSSSPIWVWKPSRLGSRLEGIIGVGYSRNRPKVGLLRILNSHHARTSTWMCPLSATCQNHMLLAHAIRWLQLV
jgi:hypothetical protein